jgi:hypothetical protein
LEHFGLIGIGSDESIDSDLLLLADSMGPCCGLDIVLGVPVGIIDDDFSGGDEINAHSACLGGDKEDVGSLLVEASNCLVPLGGRLAALE